MAMTQTQNNQPLTDKLASGFVTSYLTDGSLSYDGTTDIATIVWQSKTRNASTIIRVRLVAGRAFVDFAAITCDSTVCTFGGLGALDDNATRILADALDTL